MKDNERQWTIIAERIVANEFHDADAAMREALAIGVRSYQTPVCQRALAKLREMHKRIMNKPE